ncbi:MAG: hypothetical protein SNJ75_01130 [Gemmataceae bacterium]
MPAALLLLILLPSAERYGVAEDATGYPQKTPQEALNSVLKAIEAKDFRYLVAHLAEPSFVDDRVKRVYGGRFEEQVEDTRTRMDALVIKQFSRLAKEGKMEVGKIAAIIRSEDYPDRMIRLVPRDGKWYLSHSFTPLEK